MPTTTNTDGLFRDVSPYCASCVPSSGIYHMVFQSHCDWTTAIVFCIDCLYPSSTVSNLFRTLLRDSSSESVGQSSSRTRSSAYTGYAFLQESISFKLAVMTYRAIHGTASIYLQSCFTRLVDMTSRPRLWSSASQRLAVLPVRLTTVGKRAFPVSGAVV